MPSLQSRRVSVSRAQEQLLGLQGWPLLCTDRGYGMPSLPQRFFAKAKRTGQLFPLRPWYVPAYRRADGVLPVRIVHLFKQHRPRRMHTLRQGQNHQRSARRGCLHYLFRGAFWRHLFKVRVWSVPRRWR